MADSLLAPAAVAAPREAGAPPIGAVAARDVSTDDVLKQVSASANSSATPKEGSMAAMASPTNQKSSMNEPATDDPFAGL